MKRRRPKRSAAAASGRAARAPISSTEPRPETSDVVALNSDAIAGSAMTRIEPSKPPRTTARPAHTSVTRCRRSSSSTPRIVAAARVRRRHRQRPSQAVPARRPVGGRRRLVRARARPRVRPSGPERRGQDHRGQGDRRAASSRRRLGHDLRSPAGRPAASGFRPRTLTSRSFSARPRSWTTSRACSASTTRSASAGSPRRWRSPASRPSAGRSGSSRRA